MAFARVCAALAAGLSLGATSAIAQNLKYASGYPPTSPVFSASEAFIKYVTENSDVELTYHHSDSLLNFTEMSPGPRAGIADIGVVLPPYFAASYPSANLAANLMLATSGTPTDAPGAVMAGAFMEYVFLNCPGCAEDYKRQNQVYLGSQSTGSFDLLCTSPIRSMADMTGKRIRTGAGNFGRFAEHFGGVQVTIPAQEMYEALGQGIVDCSAQSVAEPQGYQMSDVVKYAILGIPGGTYAAINTQDFNRESWQSLSEDQRGVMLREQGVTTDTWDRLADPRSG